MAILKTGSLQRSDWSVALPISSLHSQYSDVSKTKIITRSNSIHPVDGGWYSSNEKSQGIKNKCKASRCCSSIPPLIRGFVIGIIFGCLILAIVLPLWLVKPAAPTSVATPALRWNPAGITVAGLVGNPGNRNNQLNLPVDIVLDWANNFYVADFLNNRVQKYLFGASVGITVAGNLSRGVSASQLSSPGRVLLDSNENLYITDTGNHRIQFWKKNGANGTTIAGESGIAGNASNQLLNPYGIALHPTLGTLYIADYGNNRLTSYPPGATNGTLLLGGNGLGISNTQLCTPVGLHYDSFTNTLVIANFACHNIVRYVFGATSWTLVAGNINGVSGATSSSFAVPIDITLDPMGNMYVADRSNHRIQFFYAGQMNGTTIAGITRVNGSNVTTLNSPWSLELDNQLNLYVADTSNHRIQKFLRY